MVKKEKEKENGLSFLRQLTFIMGFIALAVVMGIGMLFFNDSSSEYEVVIEIIPKMEEIIRNVPFEIEIEIDNKTQNFLKDAEIVLNFEKGFKSLEYGEQQTTIRDLIGTIGEDSLSKRSYRILPIGEPNESYKITGALSYKVGKTEFEKKISKEIKIDKSALSINIKKPKQILTGSTFDIEIEYTNNSDFDFSDLGLEINYPNNFNFESSNLTPSSFNNYWDLGTLKANGEGNVTIKGLLTNDNEKTIFNTTILSSFLNKSYIVAETTFQIEAEKSPVSLKINILGNENYIAKIGDNIHYRIVYQNGTGITLNDSKIKAELVGELFDFSTLTSKAKLNSLDNTFIWDKTTNPELAKLNPGASGTVEINIGLKKTFPIKRLGDKNFMLKINGRFESPSVPYYISSDKITAGKILNTKVEGLTIIDAQAFYRDASSEIVNNGNMPPKVGEPTEYTIHWVIRNYSTDIKDIKVSANLPLGVSWTGSVKSNVDSVPSYDPKTGITWGIDEIQATRGIITAPVEAIFQVEATPIEKYIGQLQPLLSNTTLRATDKFTDKILQTSDTFLNTSLFNDKTVEMSQGIVIR